MLRYFLDPALFCYDIPEWEDRKFDRLERLLAFLVQVEMTEETFRARDWKFRFSDDLMSDIFEVNPFRNEPDVSEHWKNVFSNQILPSLSRRVIYCPSDDSCSENGSHTTPPEVGGLPNHIGGHWKALLELCGCCGHTGDKVYIHYPPARSVRDAGPFFDEEIDLDKDIKGQFPVETYFPQDVAGPGRLKHWRLALKYFRRRMLLEDKTWAAYRWRSSFVLTDDFFESLRRARFFDEAPVYFDRLLRVMNEIICGRSIIAHIHDMSPQTFSFGHESHTKMNAYVFQMGPDANDRRCSRIYFCIRRGGPWFMEYDADAH
jgi:hypothetical protein